METQKSQELRCTLFSGCMDNKGTLIEIFNWLEGIKFGTDKAAVQETRRLYEIGDNKAADEKKRQLRAIIPTGIMLQGRTENDPIELTGIGWADIDIHNFDWSLDGIRKFTNYPGIIGAHRTVRGGLHIFFLMPPGTNRENYKFVLNVILEEIDHILGCQHDKQTCTLSHLCSTSYDPETYIADPASLEPFPYEKALCRIQKEVYKELNGEISPKKSTIENSDRELSIDEEIDISFDEVMGKEHTTYTKTELDNHFNRFIGRCPMNKGMRNQNLIRLGQYAHYMRYNAEEVDYLVKTATYLINDPEYRTKDVRNRVCWGYRHNDKQIDFEKITKQDFKGEADLGQGAKAQKAHLAHNKYSDSDDLIEQSDFERRFRKTVADSCPYIPTLVYENLPKFFTPLLSNSPNRRDIDISLLGAIIATGAAMPKLTVQCRESNYSTNLYCLCIGPAASGKSAATKAPLLLKEIDAEMRAENEQRQDAYEKQLVLWDLELKKSLKERRMPDWDMKPKGEPPMRKILAESQTSRSKLVIDLANNPEGLFMFTSELNTLNESLNSQSGHHNAELAKIAMNEPVGLSYKNDKKDVECFFPKLSFFATGTPNQHVDFIGHAHEGMESRVLIILTTSNEDWMSWGESKEETIRQTTKNYDDAAHYLLRVYKYLQQSPTHVTVPAAYRSMCDQYCSYYHKRLKDVNLSSLDSIVKRAPIMIARICGILCGLRKYEMGLDCHEMEASEEDVEIALKIIMTLMQHTFVATTMITGRCSKVNAPHAVFTRENVFKKLPTEFTTRKYVEICQRDYGLSKATIKRDISKWLEEKLIIKLRRGYYTKSQKGIISF